MNKNKVHNLLHFILSDVSIKHFSASLCLHNALLLVENHLVTTIFFFIFVFKLCLANNSGGLFESNMTNR